MTEEEKDITQQMLNGTSLQLLEASIKNIKNKS